MSILTQITISGNIVPNAYNIKVDKSMSENNSASSFSCNVENLNGVTAGSYGLGDEVIISANTNSESTYESNSGDTGTTGGITYGSNWSSQTFTMGNTGSNRTIDLSKIKIKVYRIGNPGTVTVSIRAVDGSNKPTGSDLSTGTFNANTLTTSTSGENVTVNMSTTTLSKSTQYAIVFRATSGDVNNQLVFRSNGSTYTGGEIWSSTNSGSSWSSIFSGTDFVFDILGILSSTDLDTIFTGILEDINFRGKNMNEKISFTGRDYTARLMDRTIEPEVYTNLLAGSIVTDIMAKYVDDITTNNVNDSTKTISRLAFNHKPVYDGITQLANLANFVFYVDNDKDLHFEERSSSSSNEIFSSGNVISATFKERRDTIFNEVWVYGDRYLDSYKEEFTANGGSVFTLVYKPHNTEVDVGSPISISTRQRGAIANMSVIPQSGTDYLVEYHDKKIIFISGTSIGYSSIPSSGTNSLVTINYKRSLPIVKVSKDNASIGEYGKRVKLITDKNIKDPDEALDRAVKEVDSNSQPKKQGTLKLKGLFSLTPSHTCTVDLPWHNVNNQVYDILNVGYDFSKPKMLSEEVMTIKVNKKIDDITDKIKNIDIRLRKIEGADIDTADIITRAEFINGSAGVRTSGLFIKTRTLGSSFILSVGPHNVTGPTFGGILGSVVASGINFLGDSRSGFTIQWSGGFF